MSVPLGCLSRYLERRWGEGAMSREMQVVISHLTKRFATRPVLDDVSLTVDAGQTIALIGAKRGRQIDVVALDQRTQ